MDGVSVVPFDRSEARRAADLPWRFDAEGTPIGAVDAVIEATALDRDETVLTRDVSAFDRVEGLHVVPYRNLGEGSHTPGPVDPAPIDLRPLG